MRQIFEDVAGKHKIMSKWFLTKQDEKFKLNLPGSEGGWASSSCGHGIETQGSVKCREFLYVLLNSQV